MRSAILYLFGAVMLSATPSFSQKQIGYKADKIKFLQSYKGGAKRLIGHVQFTHENMVMTCDSSYFLDNNTIEAFSNIVIRQGDSLTITGDNAKYDGNTKLGLIEGNVICTEKDMTLKTAVLTFDVKNSLVSYTTGGAILSKDNTLTSQHGYYHSPTKSVSFKYDVRLVNPEYVMTADTLKYLTVSKTAVFLGPTNIKSKKDNLYCEQGWYNTHTQISHLTQNAVIYSGPNILHADSIHYDKKKETGYAFSNVRVIDNEEKIIINGEKAYTNQKKKLTWITGKTLLEKFLKKDTLYASADTIWAYEKSIPVKKKKNIGQDSAAMAAKPDSLGRKIKADSIAYLDSTVIKAYHHVKMYMHDMQGIADSMIYSAYDSSATLIHMPLLWYKQSQLSGKKITVYFTNNKISRLHIPENTFMVEEADSVHYSQVKGKELWGYFKNDSSQVMDITGNAQAVYYLKNDKKKLQGVNTIESSHVKMIREAKSTKVTFVKKPKAKIIPMKDVKPKELELKGFTWQIEKRPRSKEDLLK